MEKQYVDDSFPTDFPVVAPFLADIDTSRGRGQIYYRVTETPSVLNRVAQVCPFFRSSLVLLLSTALIHSVPHVLIQEVHRGFPDAKFTPTHAVVATWENVAAYDDQARTTGPSDKVRWTEGGRSYRTWAASSFFLNSITCNQSRVEALFVIPLFHLICLLTFSWGQRSFLRVIRMAPSQLVIPSLQLTHRWTQTCFDHSCCRASVEFTALLVCQPFTS